MHLGALMLACAAFMPHCQRCSGRRVEARRGLEVGGSPFLVWLDRFEFARAPHSWTKSVRSVLVFGFPYRKGMAPIFVELALQTYYYVV
jgi:hypothetical protein